MLQVKENTERRHVRPQFHCRRGDLLTPPLLPEPGIGNGSPMTIGKAEMQPPARRMIQLVRRQIVAHPVSSVVGEPELMRLRMPIEPNRIADAPREDLQLGPVRQIGRDRRVARVFALTDITWRADRDIQPAVGTEANELPAMMAIPGKAVVHYHGRRRVLQVSLDIVVPQDPVYLGYVERAVVKCDAIRHIQAT